MLVHPDFQPCPCMANITKVTRRIRNRVDTMLVFSRNMIFARRTFNFVKKKPFLASFAAKEKKFRSCYQEHALEFPFMKN